MPLTRRQFLQSTGALAGAQLLMPVVVRAGEAFGQTSPDPASATRNRLVVIFQAGGNDGLNTLIPMGDVAGAARHSVYRKVRPSIAYDPSVVLPLSRPGDTDHQLGLNPKLTTLHDFYTSERLAVVQGVDYPEHSYSHFTSSDIWESGQPETAVDSGWLGRHLDRAGVGVGELRGLGIGTELPLALTGREQRGSEVARIPLAFADGTAAVGDARHAAFARYGEHPIEEYLRHIAGRQAQRTVELLEDLETAEPATPRSGNGLADALITARTLLANDYGVECVFLRHPGYDTHATQVSIHERLLTDLDTAVEAFYFGTIGGNPVAGVGPIAPELADRTLIVLTSEFGRRIGETGGSAVAGTDHGAAAPLLILGPQNAANGMNLVPGLHGEHPDMGSPTLPADNLVMTADLRTVYQAVLQDWLGNPDPAYVGRYDPFSGLFRAV